MNSLKATHYIDAFTIALDDEEGEAGERDYVLATVTHGDPDDLLMNASLLAAAPDMLAALRQCLPLLDAYRRATGGDGDLTAALVRHVIKTATTAPNISR